MIKMKIKIGNRANMQETGEKIKPHLTERTVKKLLSEMDLPEKYIEYAIERGDIFEALTEFILEYYKREIEAGQKALYEQRYKV